MKQTLIITLLSLLILYSAIGVSYLLVDGFLSNQSKERAEICKNKNGITPDFCNPFE